MSFGNTRRRVCRHLLMFAVLLSATSASAAPYNDDYDNLRDLYELLIRKEAAAAGASISLASHQMERKGGRSPSLRLRFGRRADPLWQSADAAFSN